MKQTILTYLQSLLLACAFLQAGSLSAAVCDDVLAFVPDTTHADSIPVVCLQYDEEAFNDKTFIPATFSLYAADIVRQKQCLIRHRGATSLMYDKPNFALKFVHDDGSSDDVRLLGMRKDNYWILDAMASDCSKMRNRVSMDLWLDFSRPPYHQADEPNAVNGYHGRYVEVYVNGSYYGVFCLMERVDRKQLKLKKYREAEIAEEADGETVVTPAYHRGLLYKATNGHGTRTPYLLWQQNEPDDTKPTYDGMQAEYPDPSEGEPFAWNPLRDDIYFLAAKTSTTFNRNIGKHFDVPVFIDYVLFIDLLYANDNVGKNVFYWYYDQTAPEPRVGITPWDLDTSWGRNYMSSRVAATDSLKNRSNFDTRFRKWYNGYTDTLAVRYAELRDSLWREDSLCARFDRYFSLLEQTGAWQRELERWQGSNCRLNSLEAEREYVSQWIHDRLAYLDPIYGYEAPEEKGENENPDLALPIISAHDRQQGQPAYFDLFGHRLQAPRAGEPCVMSGQKQKVIVR